MQFDIIDQSINQRFLIKYSGTFTSDEHPLMLKEIISKKNWQKGMDLLFDYRQASFKKLEISEISQIVMINIALENQFGAKRCAIVVPDDAILLAHMYKFEIDPRVEMHTEIFSPIEFCSAIKWLDSNDNYMIEV